MEEELARKTKEEEAELKKRQEEARVALEERKLILVQRKLESLRLLDTLLDRVKVNFLANHFIYETFCCISVSTGPSGKETKEREAKEKGEIQKGGTFSCIPCRICFFLLDMVLFAGQRRKEAT